MGFKEIVQIAYTGGRLVDVPLPNCLVPTNTPIAPRRVLSTALTKNSYSRLVKGRLRGCRLASCRNHPQRPLDAAVHTRPHPLFPGCHFSDLQTAAQFGFPEFLAWPFAQQTHVGQSTSLPSW